MTIKTCTKCLLELDISNFSPLIRWWHKPRCKSCQLQYYYDNREYICNQSKIYRENNKDKILPKRREYTKLYRKTPAGKLSKLNYKHRRRQLIKTTSDNTVTQETLDDMLLTQNSLCNICKCNIESRSSRHLDHVYPLSRWWLHTISNLQWLCISCNLSKSNKLI